jgi:methyl-accepting chemotaxis protein
MAGQWTFGQRLGAGFALTVLLTIATGAVAVYALRDVVASKDHVITVEAPLLVAAERSRTAIEQKGGALRGFLLTKDERLLDEMAKADRELTRELELMRGGLSTDETKRAFEPISHDAQEYQQALDKVVALRRTETTIDVVAKAFEENMLPKRTQLDTSIERFVVAETRSLENARLAANETASSATTLMFAIVGIAVLLGILISILLARTLSRQIATAVGQVQSSSAELQAAANQQATGAKEQSTAMNEISTTISELLATSRQIAQSAQRVAEIANQTAGSAKTGETTVSTADTSISGIRKQVDLVVSHMLELGKKSQQIGSVLDIVSELAEQTNILAINATIEAAGAGDAGRRFAVVADEIRKLADRVAGSTKEIRTLIEDVRGAVNTTVMVTETGSKSVDAGSLQFLDVAAAFKRIASMVATTTEAAREIELSTKQQTTAVEQVNVAIANVAQATKETEASSSQTLMTASQLATLSKDLLRLVQPQAV